MLQKRIVLENLSFLLSFLCISKKQLGYLAFGKNSRSQTLYTSKTIGKKDGKKRILLIPNDKLKIIQKHILKHILPFGFNLLKDNCTGFVPNKSICDNAKFHLGQKLIIKIDIQDFFPTISQNRVYGMFKNLYNYNHEISSYLTGLTTFDNQLPQGSPSSPAIANIIASFIDNRIIQYLNKVDKNISYSRYADDITIGVKNSRKINLSYIVGKIIEIIEEEGFLVNMKKLGVFNSAKALNITGVYINSGKLTLGRTYYKKIRAIIYNIKKLGRVNQCDKYNEKEGKNLSVNHFKNHLYGHIYYIRMVNFSLGEKLYNDIESYIPPSRGPVLSLGH